MTLRLQDAKDSRLPVECCGIRCSEQNLAEIDSGRIMVIITKAGIQRITLRYGLQAPHPIRQTLIGVVLTAFGYYPALYLLRWVQRGGVLLSSVLWIVPIVVIGIATIFGAFKRGHFLHVEGRQGDKRLAFRRKPDPRELEIFLAAVESSYRLEISREV